MRNMTSSGRSKSTKDQGNNKTAQPQIQTNSTVKSEGPPVKIIQPTAEQVLLSKLINTEHVDDATFQREVTQIMDLTGCEQSIAETALHDACDIEKAVNSVLEGKTDKSEWRESGKKKKKQKTESTPQVPEEMPVVESKPEKRDIKERYDKDHLERTKDDMDNDRGFREQSDNFRRSRRNDNRPPRLSRGRGRSDRVDERPDRDDDNEKDVDNRERGDRGFDRGRGRGRNFGPRRGRGNFRPSRGGYDKGPSRFDNGPQIDTWTNETAVIGEKEPKISNWVDTKDDWSEDIDSWTGSLAETKVFTSSVSSAVPDHLDTVHLETSNLANTFDISALYGKHAQNDLSADANYISHYNQQATESIKNSIGIGSGSSSSLHNSMTSQTASNVSALVSLQQNAIKDMSELTGSSLTGTGLTGSSLVGNSLTNALSTTSRSMSSLTGSVLPSTNLGVSDLMGNSLGGTTLSGANLGTSISGSLAGLSAGSQSASVQSHSGALSASAASQMMQQKMKAPKAKLPPPSKIPASAVEMPGNVKGSLDIQFGVEFGSDSADPFSFGGNESVSYSSSADIKSTSSISHIGQGSLNKTNEVLRNTALEQSSCYQQSPYVTTTKQNTAESSSQINSTSDPLQMSSSKIDMKSTQVISGQSTQAAQQSTKIDSSLDSYAHSSSYQTTGYTSQKSAGYQPSGKSGSYPNTQYQSSTQTPTSANQFSSQYGGRQSSQSHYQSATTQFPTGSQYQSSPSGFQSSQTGYQSSQSPYQQSSQSQFQQPAQTQYQNYQTGTTFQNQSNYSTNQSSQSSFYPNTTTNSFSTQSQQNSLYSQSSRPNSFSSQTYLNPDHAASAGSSTFQPAVTQASSTFKENQSGASSYRDTVSVPSTTKSRETQSDNSYSRDSRSSSSFSDNPSMTYNRDNESVSNSYPRESGVSYKRDSKSATGSYQHDTPSGDSGSFTRDSQSASASYTGRDAQTAPSSFRDGQSGAAGYGTQAGSYPRDTSQSQTQTGYSSKSLRNSMAEVSTLPSALTGNKLADSFSKMAVKDASMDSRQSTGTQFDTTTKVTTNTTALTSASAAVTTLSSAVTTITSSASTKNSTLPTPTASTTKAPPNLPPGVPLITQQYIMNQGSMPYYSVPQPLYNMEEFQFMQQRLPLTANAMYELATASGLSIPPTTLISNTGSNQAMSPYSGSSDSSKLSRVDAQSPTGSMTNSQQTAAGQTPPHQQPYILNYGYYYPPSMIPGAGYQYPLIPDHGPYVTSSSMIFQMPQVTNVAHAGTAATTQYQQKGYGSHVQYGTNKVYEDLPNQSAGDFSKSPYAGSQTPSKANVNASVATGTGSSDIQLSGYGKTHAQQAYDKQGYHAGTPPPFNVQIATGQLTSGTQAGPLGAPTAAYGAPYLPMITPHSQMMHPPMPDTTSSVRGNPATGTHSQSKSASKPYTATNWQNY